MIVFDLETKVLDTEIFPQHNIADLNSGITFIALFSQEKPLQWKEINTVTHILAVRNPNLNAEKLGYYKSYLINGYFIQSITIPLTLSLYHLTHIY